MAGSSLQSGLTVSLAAALEGNPVDIFAALKDRSNNSGGDDECITYRDLSYHVSRQSYKDSAPAVGDVATAGGDFFNAEGRKMASDSGRMKIVHHDPATEHWVAFTRLSYEFADGGSAFGTGFVDLNDQMAGMRITIPLVGISGRYLGKMGTVSWVIDSIKSAKTRMIFCARPLEMCCDITD